MTNWTELKRLAESIKEGCGLQGADAEEAMFNFECAATPETILALIAENERLRADGNDIFGLAQARADTIDQLRAEVEALNNECSALAAGVCDGVIGDDYGNAFCRFKSLLSECRRWVALAYDQGFEGAEDLGERIDSALKPNQ